MQEMRKALKKLLMLLFGVLLMIPPGLTSASTNAEEDDEEWVTVYHETFADDKGFAKQSGNAHLSHASDKAFEGNDDGGSLYVSNRTNDWDAADFFYEDMGLEDGKIYIATVAIYVDTDEDIPAGAQAVVQPVSDGKFGNWISNVDYELGEMITLSGSFIVDQSEHDRIRVQSNPEGASIPFYIGDILIAEKVSSGDEEEPEKPRTPAEEFSLIDFENGELNGFEPRGDTENLTVTDEVNHTEDGSLAIKVKNRTKTSNGPTLRAEEYIDLGQEYKISAWIKLISPGSVELQLSTHIGDGGSASYNDIERKTISTEDGWVQLEGTYRYSSVGEEYVTIYIESPNHETASFYIDDISFEPTGSENVEIERDLIPLKEIYKDHFLIGTAISHSDLYGSRLELLKMHHNLVTAENAMKPGGAYNEEGELDLTDEYKLVVSALEKVFKIHGHVLVWHKQSN